jgi:hypothetical protein
MATERQISTTNRQLRGLMGLLVAQFILGTSLTTFINYTPHKHSAAQTVFLVLHIIVAVGLLAQAIIRLVQALRWNILLIPAMTGFIGVIMAMVSGGIAAGDGNSVAVFMMALGFIIAFVSYGYSLGTTFPASQKQH